MKLGEHYAVKIHGETYYCVYVGAENGNHYLKDINNNVFCINDIDTSFQTIQPTYKYNEELNKINEEIASDTLSEILQNAYDLGKLITDNTPLSQIKTDGKMLSLGLANLYSQMGENINKFNQVYEAYREGSARTTEEKRKEEREQEERTFFQALTR